MRLVISTVGSGMFRFVGVSTTAVVVLEKAGGRAAVDTTGGFSWGKADLAKDSLLCPLMARYLGDVWGNLTSFRDFGIAPWGLVDHLLMPDSSPDEQVAPLLGFRQESSLTASLVVLGSSTGGFLAVEVVLGLW